MLKKYLFTFVLIFSFFLIFSNKSFAIWNKNFGTGSCSSSFVVLQVCEGYVVTNNDFADSFEVQGNDLPGKKLSFFGNFQDGNGPVPLNNTDQFPITVGTSGTASIIATTTWPNLIVDNMGYNYSVKANVKNQDGNNSGSSEYRIRLFYAPIDMLATKNGVPVLSGVSLNSGQSIYITCASTSNITYTASPAIPRGEYPVSFSPSEIETYKYAGYFTVNSTSTPRTYTITCTNVGGDVTKKSFVINATGGPIAPTHDIHISNVDSSPNRARTANTFTWNTDGKECYFYNFDRSVNYGAGSGVATPL